MISQPYNTAHIALRNFLFMILTCQTFVFALCLGEEGIKLIDLYVGMMIFHYI